MASISSLSGSSSGSNIYGTRNTNIISGLASGMDTESMIEGMVQGYQQKITSLQQDRTVYQWQQSAYQSISDKLIEFSRKYMSYTSKTNLLSSSFFTNSVVTTTNGKYASLVSAIGKSSSDISINSVAQLATSARYTSAAGKLNSSTVSNGKLTVSGGKELDLTADMQVSELEGSLTLDYGTKSVTIEFGELEFFDEKGNGTGTVTAEDLKEAIEKKLSEQTIVTSSGDSVAASELIKVEVSDTGEISFSDKTTGGNDVVISDATGKLKDTLKLDSVISGEGNSFTVSADQTFTTTVDTSEYLAGKTLQVTLDGVTKTITLPDSPVASNEELAGVLNEELTKAFGANKITASAADGKLSFTASESSTFSVASDVGEVLGIGDKLTSYLDTGKTLKELGNFDASSGKLEIGGQIIQGTLKEAVPESERIKQEDGSYTDKNGNKLDSEGYYVDSDGNRIYEYEMEINGVKIGPFTQNTELNTILNSINNSEAGVNVTYSNTTNQFVFEATESGAGGRVVITGALGTVLFGDKVSEQVGQDAIFQATVNGKTMSFTRSSNSFEIDGMNITLSGTFNDVSSATLKDLGLNVPSEGEKWNFAVGPDGSSKTITVDVTQDMTAEDVAKAMEKELGTGYTVKYDPEKGYQVWKDGVEEAVSAEGNAAAFLKVSPFVKGEAVTFTSKTDADKIVDAVKTMVEEFNTMIKEVKEAYSTMPLQQSNGSKYEPLTDEDKADMTEDAIKSYEEKAKTGILFMDRDLNNLYNDLRNAVSPGGSDGTFLRSIGLDTSYEEGLTTINFDESKFRAALESDPDGVKNAFVKSKENGASTDGLMTSLQQIKDKYAAETGARKGILVEKAGSQYAPTAALDNELLDKMEDIDDEISKWQEKMSDKVDYYTNKFTQLELLIQQMNSQSASLSGLLGG